ncbi:MAG TPA: GxxExxY protein [Syntrophorhabdaceae bacterium]|nr:GxxExxY protein [Syntrophorhabdaceae bacterium]
MKRFDVDNLSSLVIRAAINVHKVFGPSLLESIYQSSMVIELGLMGIEVLTEVPLHVSYKGRKIPNVGLRLDLLVEDTIIVELKSVEEIQPVHKKQLLTYLRLAGKPLGLLINFNTTLLREGITRVISSPQGDGNAARFR